MKDLTFTVTVRNVPGDLEAGDLATEMADALDTAVQDWPEIEVSPLELVIQPSSAQAEAVDHILAAVAGSVFRSETQSDVIIMLNHDPYAISVDEGGHTVSTNLVTVPPAEIAEALDADEAEIAGWSTGYDI